MKIDDILKKCIEIPGISIKSSETSTETSFQEYVGKGSMTFYSLFPGFTWHIFLLILPYGLHRISMKMAPMQQDLFYSIIVLQGRCEIVLNNGNYVYLKDNNLSFTEHFAQSQYQYPRHIYEGLEFLLILQLSQMKTHGCCGSLALTFIKL